MANDNVRIEIKPIDSHQIPNTYKDSQLSYFRTQASSAVGGLSPVVKAICAAVAFGYLLSFSDRALDLLTVLPGKFFPPNFWVWTCFTHVFIEVHFWMLLCDISVLVLHGKLLEPLWGAFETLKFFTIVNIVIALLTALTYVIIYLPTRNPDYLFKQHIHGFAGFLAGFSVAVKQSMPDHILVNSPFGKLRNKHVPLWVLLFSILVRVAGGVDAPFPIMFAWGILVSWIYLRFYQNHGNGNTGDMSDSFTFASFFPDTIQPIVAILSNTLHSILVRMHICKKPTRRFEISAPPTIPISLPGTDSADAERRRQLALKALNERLSRAAVTSSWPEMAEDTPTAGSANTPASSSSDNTAEDNLKT